MCHCVFLASAKIEIIYRKARIFFLKKCYYPSNNVSFPFKFGINGIMVGRMFILNLDISRIHVALVNNIIDAHPHTVGQVGISGS